MTEQKHRTDSPLASLSDAGVEALLHRAVRLTLILGLAAALIVWKASDWRNAAMLATGTAISAASILEWQRLLRYINAKLDNKQISSGAAVAVLFFLLRLLVFAGVIYGSLKGIDGSAVALLVGLGLAVVALVWEALRLLRN